MLVAFISSKAYFSMPANSISLLFLSITDIKFNAISLSKSLNIECGIYRR